MNQYDHQPQKKNDQWLLQQALLGGYVLTHKMLDNLPKANQCFILTQMQRQSRFKGSPAVAGILPLALAAAVSELSLVVLDSTV